MKPLSANCDNNSNKPKAKERKLLTTTRRIKLTLSKK